MTENDFKYEKTKLFVNDTEDLDDFNIGSYINVLTGDAKEEATPDEMTATYPVIIKSFPWNPKFEGLSFIISNVNIEEDEEGEGASLSYAYNLIGGAEELDLAQGDDTESRDTPDNELLDAFIGRLIEGLLVQMSQDKEFMQSVVKTDSEE